MRHPPDPDRPFTARRKMAERCSLGIVALALLAGLLFSIAMRGPWYDEFYTYYVTGPGFGLREALFGHWLADNHPPFFYVLVRAARGLGNNIEALRLINAAIGFIAFGCGVAAVRGNRRIASLAVIFFLFLASQRAAILYGAELRSYFLTLCSTALLVLTLTAVYLDKQPGGPWRRCALAGAILLSFNNHVVTTIVSGAILLPFLVAFTLQRNFGALRAVLIPALISGTIFLAVTAIQFPLWETNTRSFWIPAGFTAGRLTVQITAQRAMEGNIVILVLGAPGIVLALVQAIRQRHRNAELEAAAILGLGGLLAIGLVLGIHCWRPFVVEKYLTGLIPVPGMILAIGMTQLLRQSGDRLAALLLLGAAAASLVAINDNRLETARKNSWAGTAAVIGRQVARCPDTAVHIDPYWNADLIAIPPRDNEAAVAMAYQVMAQRFGFAIEPAASRRLSGSCPTLFWAEHDTRHHFTAAEILTHLREAGYPVSRIKVSRVGDGWIASTGPGPGGNVATR